MPRITLPAPEDMDADTRDVIHHEERHKRDKYAFKREGTDRILTELLA